MDDEDLFTLFFESPDDDHHTVAYNSLHQYKLSTQRASNMSSQTLLNKTWESNHKLMNEQTDELLKYVNITNQSLDTRNINSWRSNLSSSLDPVALFERSVKCIQCTQVSSGLGSFDKFHTKKCTCNLNLIETSNVSLNYKRHENNRQASSVVNLVSECSDSETKSMEDQTQLFKPKFGHPRLPKVTNQPTTSKLPPIYPDVDLQNEDEMKAHKSNIAKITFKTAKEQLLASNPAAKRTLGTSRKAQAKFVSPMIGVQEKQESCEVEVADERLKHIDPKMIELIESEIIDKGTPIGWDDIAGLHMAKSVIQEAVVWPLLRPDIFTGLRRPPKGILLFGPPGTGKTLIGKCVAAQCRATFFSISASSLTSKWIGDGEKMVRALFAVARCHQPAVIFIDEIDSLLTQRNDTEHEATRRIKTEFLVQFDGAATAEEDRLLIVGATNRPQELDEAARRRLVKRLYIPLPDVEARNQLITHLLKGETHDLSTAHVSEVARLAEGFSGADVASLCCEAAMGPVRALAPHHIQTVRPDKMRPVNVEDFKNALRRVRPSVSQDDLEQYVKWNKTFGQGF